MFEQARHRASEMGFLFDVTTAAASAETLQDAIQNVANELRNSLDALSVSIYLPQQYIDATARTVHHAASRSRSPGPISRCPSFRKCRLDERKIT